MKRIVISGTGLYTPEEQISNDELVASFNGYVEKFNTENAAKIEAGEVAQLHPSSAAFIAKASGIHSRHVVDKKGILDIDIMAPRLRPRSNDEPSLFAETSLVAAKQAIANANLTPDDIDVVIVSCSIIERSYPQIAIEVQDLLGIKGFAFDMLVGCASAAFAINIASDFIKNGTAKRVLMLNPEICSGQLNYCDRDSHFIFGDVVTAAIIESTDSCKSDNAFELMSSKLLTQFSNNIRNNSGYLNHTTPETRFDADKLFVQNGRSVFKEVLPLVSKMITDHLEENQISADNLARLWLHQANKNMNDFIGKKVMGREPTPEEQPNVLQNYGNTSSAGSIVVFHNHKTDLNVGDYGVLCAFGAGYSAASLILQKYS